MKNVSPRQREVLMGLAIGRTNAQIAADMGVSEKTVEAHRYNVARKYGPGMRGGIRLVLTAICRKDIPMPRLDDLGNLVMPSKRK